MAQGKVKGKILFADTAKPDAKYNKYKVTLLVNEAQYAVAEEAGLKASVGAYDGQEQRKVELKNPGFGTRKKDNTQFLHDPIPVLLRTEAGNVPYTEKRPGATGELETVQKEIPRNSKVIVSWEDKPYTTFGGGIAKRIRSILVVEEGATQARPEGDFDDDDAIDEDDF